MIKKLFSGQINSITVAALLVALSSLVSRFLGIFRDRILAGEFGAGDTLDVYYAAFRVPDLIFNLLVLGALSAGFVPVFVQLLEGPAAKVKGFFGGDARAAAWRLMNNVLNAMFLALLGLTLLGMVAAGPLTALIVPGFGPEKQALTAALSRIMFLSPLLLGLSSVIGGALQSFKRFFVYSLAPIFYNIGIIFGALYLAPSLGADGLAWGVALGAFLHLAVQLPLVWSLGWRYRPLVDLKDEALRRIARLMLPRTMSLAVSQINLLVITVFASTLQSGALAVFNLANNLQSFPIGLFGLSFAVAAFPTLSAAAFDRKRLVADFSTVFRQILFFIVPSTVLLLTLRAQIVRVILGTGSFGWDDTVLTIDALGFFTLSLFAQATIPLLVRVFYARQNSRTPFFVGLASAAANIALAYWLSRAMGGPGLALAFSLSAILNFALLWLALRAELGSLDEARILVSATKFSASALAAGLAVQGMKLLVWPFIDMSRFWGVLVQGLAAGSAGILVYAAFCALLKSEELFSFAQSIKRRLPWSRDLAHDHGEARGI